MFIKRTLSAATGCMLALVAAAGSASAAPVPEGYDLEAAAREGGISVSTIRNAFSRAHLQPKIIEAITRPAELKPWWQFRKIFVTKSRIDAALKFYAAHERTLKRAEDIYGVPPEIVCAIIAVETLFGQNMGSWKVLDALYTLGFNYPKRGKYFASEFLRYLSLCGREGWDLEAVRGSYAGAMGMGQFMPSSYLQYAVDFNGDGKVNLFTDPDDAIGSVANYFMGHGWQRGRGIYYAAHLNGADPAPVMAREWKNTPEAMYKAGISTKVTLSGDQEARLFKWELEDGSVGYGIGLSNFHTIMRYNTSSLYARVVYEIAELITMERRKSGAAAPGPRGRRP